MQLSGIKPPRPNIPLWKTESAVPAMKASNTDKFDNRLQLVCWPELTDDRICRRFSRGFYKSFPTTQGADVIKAAFERGLLQLGMMQTLELTPELVRGEVPAELTALKMPELVICRNILENKVLFF